ncbi:MAG: asparaginase [Verrucomicrobia bacterium]|nr:asparaginase [Verrucomicrobiota bacterium]
MRLHVITTGGTIDKVYFDAKSEYAVGSPQIEEILRDANVTLEVTVESVLRKDSLEMNEADRALVRERVAAAPCDRVLVTHGTDTMVETAVALLGMPGKTIVLTGSMQPARFRNTDAVFNIGTAIGAIQCLPPGVYLAMNGRVFDPRRVRKNRARQAFEEVD